MNVDCLKIAAALVMTAPFVPMLFQGEEWAASTPFLYFSGHPDPELGRAVSEGRKQEFSAFGWNPDQVPDPQASETFARSKLNWNELTREPHSELLQWHRRLIRLRTQTPELTDGRLDRIEPKFDERARWLTMTRGAVEVLINFAQQAQAVPLTTVAGRKILLASHSDIVLNADLAQMPAESVIIARTE